MATTDCPTSKHKRLVWSLVDPLALDRHCHPPDPLYVSKNRSVDMQMEVFPSSATIPWSCAEKLRKCLLVREVKMLLGC